MEDTEVMQDETSQDVAVSDVQGSVEDSEGVHTPYGEEGMTDTELLDAVSLIVQGHEEADAMRDSETLAAVRSVGELATTTGPAEYVVTIADEQWQTLADKGNKALDMASNLLYLVLVLMILCSLAFGMRVFRIFRSENG